MDEHEKQDKVIRGIEHCIGDNCNGDKWNECKYSGHGCIDALLEDALALLKEQEQECESITLKECPFCGGEANGPTDAWPHMICCDSCGAGVKGFKFGEEGEREAIEKWNRRVNDG